ncbi:MAG: hypothetical protein Q4G59_03950, partial [Planctomycetia bacterium]|nr:hypothetical protein [Planctomycetia bacterium]
MGEIISTLIFEIDTRHTQEELDDLEQKTTRLTEKLNAASESFERFFQNASHSFSMRPDNSFLQDNDRQVAPDVNKNAAPSLAVQAKTNVIQEESLKSWGKSGERLSAAVAPFTDSSSAVQTQGQLKNFTLIEQVFNDLLSKLERSLNRQESSPNMPFQRPQSDTWNTPERTGSDSYAMQSIDPRQADDSHLRTISRTGNEDALSPFVSHDTSRVRNAMIQAVSSTAEPSQTQPPYTSNHPSIAPERPSRENPSLNDYFGQLLNRLAPFAPNSPKQETEQKQRTWSNESNRSNDNSTGNRLQAEIPFESSLSDIKRLLERQTSDMLQQWKASN